MRIKQKVLGDDSMPEMISNIVSVEPHLSSVERSKGRFSHLLNKSRSAHS